MVKNNQLSAITLRVRYECHLVLPSRFASLPSWRRPPFWGAGLTKTASSLTNYPLPTRI